MTTSRVIGYQENAVKITSMGRAKASAVRPPPRTHSRDEPRSRRRGFATSTPTTTTGSLAVADSPEITSRLSRAGSRAVTFAALTLRGPGSNVTGTADGEPRGLPVEPGGQEASSLP